MRLRDPIIRGKDGVVRFQPNVAAASPYLIVPDFWLEDLDGGEEVLAHLMANTDQWKHDANKFGWVSREPVNPHDDYIVTVTA